MLSSLPVGSLANAPLDIAVVGAGIAGLVTARLLSRRHRVTVFEAADHLGGHAHTVRIDLGDETQHVDTGFVVFNERTYPHFVRLLDRLGVRSRPTTMSFSVRCDRSGIEYNGTSINRLFAQRGNLLRPRFYRMLADIVRFNRAARELAGAGDEATTVGAYLEAHRYGTEFVERYLVPMGSAIWSCPAGTFRRFPIRFVAEFFRNHGLLDLAGRPVWRVIDGGSSRYVERLAAPCRDRIRLGCPVRRVTRRSDRVEVVADGGVEAFDQVVFACHSDQALRALADPTPLEREALEALPYEQNEAMLHTDPAVLPRRRLAWAAWNYRVPAERDPTVSYNMNILQHLRSRRVFCVTLNDRHIVDPARVIRRMTFEHPVYTTRRAAAQRQHPALIGTNRTSYCGAYWGYGFHEDGVRSALAVCRAFGTDL